MLNPETLYVVEDKNTVLWGRTPDGIGMYWYDEDDENAKTDVCDFKRVHYFESSREFDNFRDGLN